MRSALLAFVLLFVSAAAIGGELVLDGPLRQGGLIVGHGAPGLRATLDGRALRVDTEGRFVFGFGRDAAPSATLVVTHPDGAVEERQLAIAQRAYDVQRIDGLAKSLVTPPDEVVARIRDEAARVRAARKIDSAEALFAEGFVWPARGRISGIYGSQRILNGEPRQPHYGIDIAAPTGTPVVAPAPGVVTLVEPDLYFSGGTLIIDHGHGVSSAFLHLERIEVGIGDRVARGQPIATVGATGRVTGPHLDWRVNWFEERLDPALLVGPMPRADDP